MPDQDFGNYKVICQIGKGGMGIIYKAQDPRLNRMVAIKQLILDNVDDDKKDEFRERFRREAQLAANLNHPNIISIYDISITPANSYYVMELLEGHNLRMELEQRLDNRMSPDEFFPILQQVCQGLAHAHDMGLVHRDIKPDNIFLLPGGKIKITDFGIARAAEVGDSNLTKPGVMLGTLSYVSPEQLQDARQVDHRADIYSLGVVAYEALSGQVPFVGDGLTTTLMMIISREPRPLNEVNPNISPDITSVVGKAMRKNAIDRYQSLYELEREFERALGFGRPQTGTSSLRQSGGFHPLLAPGALPPSGQNTGSTSRLQPTSRPPDTGEGPSRSVVKPWLAGRTGDIAKPAGPQPITQSVALVKAITCIGKQGEGRGCFIEPSAIAARSGRIVVADAGTRKFQIFSRDGRVTAEMKTIPGARGTQTGGGAFSKPAALAMDQRGRIYGVDSADHFIRVYDSMGAYNREFYNKHGKTGGLTGAYCDTAGYLYLSDPDNGCIHIISAETGNYVRKIGSKGQGEGQLHLPAGLGIDRFGQLFVVDYGTSRVSVYSKAGLYQRCWGSKGSGRGQFNIPRGIAIDRYDRVYIADTLNHRVCVFTSSGDYLFSFGGRGTELGKFVGPADLSIDPENNCLYIVDKGNGRVQVFEILLQ